MNVFLFREKQPSRDITEYPAAFIEPSQYLTYHIQSGLG
jgi:hypothetical protein